MKYAYALAALAAVVAAQVDPTIIPECARKCLLDATASATSCKEGDYVCSCEPANKSAIQAAATGCVVGACGADVALNQVLPASDKLCAAASAGSGTSASASASSSAAASSAASAASSVPPASMPSVASTTAVTVTASPSASSVVVTSTRASNGTASASGTASGTAAATTSAVQAGAAGLAPVGGLAMLVLGALAI
ncbi:hypothetical protein COL5a_004929 [Colletotrichum fioriniae]|nr:hypothetical protein COL5a_004929 [Colletotrichum fioriniae]